MDKKYRLLIFPILVIFSSIVIALWEATIVYKYQTSINKNKYQNDACLFTIIKSILNILYAIYIFRDEILKRKEKCWDFLKILTMVINIWCIILYSNLNKFGIFIQVILLEFIIISVI